MYGLEHKFKIHCNIRSHHMNCNITYEVITFHTNTVPVQVGHTHSHVSLSYWHSSSHKVMFTCCSGKSGLNHSYIPAYFLAHLPQKVVPTYGPGTCHIIIPTCCSSCDYGSSCHAETIARRELLD